MSWTYSPGASDRDTVRLLITDTDVDNQIFSNEELDVFAVLEEGDVRLAAAAALETMATDQVKLLKVVTRLDVTTDGAKVSAELRARAKALRDQVIASSATDPVFDWAEMGLTAANKRERRRNQALRGYA